MSSQLFQSISIGPISLQHRVLAPLTPAESAVTRTPGTLLITEFTIIAAKTGRFPNMPGIWSSEQINAWRGGYHFQPTIQRIDLDIYVGSFIFLQLLALGRGAIPSVLRAEDPTDVYGGSANRARFPLEVVKAVAAAVGERIGMADPVPTYSHIVSEPKRLHPTLAYIHVIEPRISPDPSVDTSPQNAGQSNDFIRDIWGDRPFISGGGFTRDSGIKLAEECKNPLVAKKYPAPLHSYDRPTFCLPGQDALTGYTDQPFATLAA
ncbi:NADH:flavin oxidoreductase/NADH oxidase [Mycena olivaceomarginata]|nr:NADH:flavin oxidoreductase/NADH oxidase [Mycena olivaceomarginata]